VRKTSHNDTFSTKNPISAAPVGEATWLLNHSSALGNKTFKFLHKAPKADCLLHFWKI